MSPIDIDQARARLSQLVNAIRSGIETEIVITESGVPAARLMPIPARRPLRFGLAKGKWDIPDDIDELNPEIEKLFYAEPIEPND